MNLCTRCNLRATVFFSIKLQECNDILLIDAPIASKQPPFACQSCHCCARLPTLRRNEHDSHFDQMKAMVRCLIRKKPHREKDRDCRGLRQFPLGFHRALAFTFMVTSISRLGMISLSIGLFEFELLVHYNLSVTHIFWPPSRSYDKPKINTAGHKI